MSVRHLRIVLLLLLTGWLAFGYSQQTTPSDRSHKAKQTKLDQAHPEKPVTAKVVEPPKDEPKARSEWWLVALTGALVVMAIVQAAVFAYQGVQLKETVKATRANVDALTNAERAHLSFEAFRIIDEQSQGQRLYPTSQGEINSPIAISVDLKNYGRTPATITAFWIAPIVVEKFGCGELLHAHGTVSLAQPIAPSARDSRTKPIALAEWGEVLAGTKKLVIYGHTEYRDIFGETHISGFACLYIPPGPDQDEKFASVCLDSHWYST